MTSNMNNSNGTPIDYKRQNSANTTLSQKLLSIKPPTLPSNLINSQILNSSINNNHTVANQLYSQLQLRSDELDRVKTNVSSTSNQTKLNANSNAASLLHLTDFIKNQSKVGKQPSPPQHHHHNNLQNVDHYSNDDISMINLNRKSAATFNALNSSFDFSSVAINGGAIGKVNDYQRSSTNHSSNHSQQNGNQQQQRKVFLQKSESDSSIKHQRNNFDINSTTESNQQSSLNAKILKVI